MRWLDGITDSMDMFEQALGVGGQGSLAAVHGAAKELDMTEQLNNDIKQESYTEARVGRS